MASDAIILQIELLQIQIELQESNYKYAVQLQKDHETLRRMRTNIRELKDTLESLQRKYLTLEPGS